MCVLKSTANSQLMWSYIARSSSFPVQTERVSTDLPRYFVPHSLGLFWNIFTCIVQFWLYNFVACVIDLRKYMLEHCKLFVALHSYASSTKHLGLGLSTWMCQIRSWCACMHSESWRAQEISPLSMNGFCLNFKCWLLTTNYSQKWRQPPPKN